MWGRGANGRALLPLQHLFHYLFPNPRTLSSTLFLAQVKGSQPASVEGISPAAFAAPRLGGRIGWGQLSLLSLKRVERRGRGVLVGLGGRSPSFRGRVLRSGITGSSRSYPRLWRGASMIFGEAAGQRVLKGQLLPAPQHPKVTSACSLPTNSHTTSSGPTSR